MMRDEDLSGDLPDDGEKSFPVIIANRNIFSSDRDGFAGNGI
jgi:hypothetical protein